MTVDSKEEALAIASLTGIHYFGKHLEFSLGASDSYASPGQVSPPLPLPTRTPPPARSLPPSLPRRKHVKFSLGASYYRANRAAQQGGATARHIIREAQ